MDILGKVEFTPGFLWTTVKITAPNHRLVQLDGIPNAQAIRFRKADRPAQIAKSKLDTTGAELAAPLDLQGRHTAVDAKRNLENDAGLTGQFDLQAGALIEWAKATIEVCKAQLGRRGLLGQEFIQEISDSKPRELMAALDSPEVMRHLDGQAETVKQKRLIILDAQSVFVAASQSGWRAKVGHLFG